MIAAESLSRCRTGVAGMFFLALACVVCAEPVPIDVPAGPADEAVLALARQAGIEVLFSYDQLHAKRAAAAHGLLEPEDALRAVLEGTGYAARPNGRGRFVVAPAYTFAGSVRGRVVGPDGQPVGGLRIAIDGTRLAAVTDRLGGFYIDRVPEGTYQVVAMGPGYTPLIVDGVRVTADEVLTLETLAINVPEDPARMAPYVVQARSAIPGPLGDGSAPPAPRSAAGNIDMARTADDALGFQVFTREQIERSGLVDLNAFLKRELLNSDASTLPPEQNARVAAYASGSTNLSLAGFLSRDDATVILLNGRRLPEIVTARPADPKVGPQPPTPDVNVIPMDLIDRVEVLPASASALYSGSPVGGVINIVLRPNVNTTEVTTTYANAMDRFDSPESTTSVLFEQTLLGGALQVRLNATFTQVTPPTEQELGYVRATLGEHPVSNGELFRATPNVFSASGSGLFGPGSAAVTSVAPGADGNGGLAAFSGRQGVESLGLFAPKGGGLVDSPGSLGYPYGRQGRDFSLYGSVTYDPAPWIEIGVDATASHTVNRTGYSLFSQDLSLAAGSPLNPFGQPVTVVLNEVPLALGADYNEARIDYYSVVAGVLLKGWKGWEVSVDSQYGLSVTSYRGIEGVDSGQWQALVDAGLYNPLRDTQVFGPPQAFYDRALLFFGRKGQFVTLGDYSTLDGSLRIANPSLELPTGSAAVTLGGD